MTLIILRAAFILITSGLGIVLINSEFMPKSDYGPFFTLAGMLTLALLVILVDILAPRKRLDAITAVYFGLLVGFFLAYMINIGLTPFFDVIAPKSAREIQSTSHLILTVFMCYISISLLMQTRNDFRFVIPYVEFRKELKGLSPYVLDKSVVIDGRILDIVATPVLDCPLILPQFVITELQEMTDSTDKTVRLRGQRGLDILNKLRKAPGVEFQLDSTEHPEFRDQTTEMKLVILAQKRQAKLATTDYSLNQIAKLNDIKVLNLNDLANAMKPVFVVGDQLEVPIQRTGEEPSQGVGFLPDGTMVVVEGGKNHIGKTLRIAVTSVLQTSAGRLIFGKITENDG